MSAVLWFVLGGILVAAELATLTYVLGLLAVAAVAAGVVALVADSLALELLVAAGSATTLMVLVLPVARRHRQVPPTASGTAALVGAPARAITAVDADGGTVKLAGEVWSARAALPHTTIAAGAEVSVLAIDGATAVVHAVEL